MKKINRAILVVTLLAAFLCSAAAPALAAETFDFQAVISEFQPNYFNDNTLTVGQTHQALGAIWADSGTCYTSNADVVTIADDGTVTAVGEGTCYVAVVASTGMYEVSRYTVTAAVTQPAIPTQATKPVQATQAAPQPAPQPVTKATGKVTISENLQEKLDDMADKEGMQEQYDKTRKKVSGFFLFFVPFFALVLVLVVYVWITTAHLHKTSVRTRVLPARCRTGNTITKGEPPRTACPKCGTPYGESNFCPKCGTGKIAKSVFQFPIDRSISVQKFETQLNQWLAENPYIYDCKLSLETKQKLYHLFVHNKFVVKKAVLTFSVADKPVAQQYGFAFAYQFRMFGPFGYSHEKLVAKWEKNNPGARVVNTQGGHIEHIGSQSGISAEYYGYIFYQK